jgi:putative endonuclease
MLMRMFPAHDLGRFGERYAAWYYRLRGYRVIGRNVRMRDGELDLIVRRGDTLAFVEVKTRQPRSAGEGFEAVNRAKQSQISRLADRWLAQHPHDGAIRFDVLSLRWTGRRFETTQVADAFCAVADTRSPWRMAA